MNNAHIYGILFDCPFKIRLKDCVINEVLHLNPSERVMWFERLDESKKAVIIGNHLNCSGNRSRY